MAERMLKFVTVPQQMPTKRDVAERREDFDEIYRAFAETEAKTQSSRCSQCGVPFCSVHCPLSNNIPDWLKLTAEGRLEEAYEVSSATNTFPEICGRICPQDRLCEGNCVIEKGWVKPSTPRQELPHSVGIVGAGPGGLAAAEMLRRRGYQVTVYDRHDRPGGLLIYGIPNFKLEKDVVIRRWNLLVESGIRFELNCAVGETIAFGELRKRHDAVLITTGVYKARDIGGPGSGLAGIVPALDYLTASNREGLGDAVPAFVSGELNAAGKDVVVIGGGDTAMDCVRTAVRQGAKSVKCLYRRDKANMPGSMRETKNAQEEGVDFVWLSAPEAFLGDGTVNAVRAVRMHLGLPDASGRQSVDVIPGSHFNVKADLVIKALGFDPEDLPQLFNEPGLEVNRNGAVKVNFRTFMTQLPGVFAAGDIVRGASLVVWAIRDGRDAAAQVDAYISQQTAPVAAAAE